MGQLVFQATLGGQVNLVGPNTASTFNLNVPAVSSTLATLTGTETFTNKTLTSPTLTTPVLGTPASGTLTNCTGLPNAGLVNSSVTVGSTAIALGATATTIAGLTSLATNTLTSASATALTLQSAGTTAITVDTSQRVGVGVTPSVQYSGIKALQIGSTTNLYDNGASTKLYHNAYTAASGDDTYLTTGYAQGYLMPSNGQHLWYTSASGTAGNAITFTQAMTLDASGQLLVGKTASSQTVAGCELRPSSAYFAQTGIAVYTNMISGTGDTIQFRQAASPVGSISVTTVATLYNTTSDQRLKENIQEADSASSLIDSLQVRKFDWKKDSSHQRYGFVAQELVAVAPEVVNQPADPDDMMAVDYSKLVPMLVKEIQSLRVRVASLESN